MPRTAGGRVEIEIRLGAWRRYGTARSNTFRAEDDHMTCPPHATFLQHRLIEADDHARYRMIQGVPMMLAKGPSEIGPSGA